MLVSNFKLLTVYYMKPRNPVTEENFCGILASRYTYFDDDALKKTLFLLKHEIVVPFVYITYYLI